MIHLDGVSFSYTGNAKSSGVKNVSLRISRGEVVAVCGKSGCGKTTLTRLINGLIPHYHEGELAGSVLVDNKSVPDIELYDLAGTVGSVFQNPRSQFFSVSTTDELAFGCENMGLEGEAIAERISEAASMLSLEPLLDRSIFKLSAGEKQKIACGSIAAMHPDVIVLDEPTSNLDYRGIRDLREALAQWKSEGKTIVVAEHRLHFLNGIADRITLMEDGRVSEQYEAKEFFLKPKEFFESRGLRVPSLDCLRTKKRGLSQASTRQRITLEKFQYHFGKGRNARLVLDIPHVEIPRGIVAVLGLNGAGKTTLAKSLCGLLRHDGGVILRDGTQSNAAKRLRENYLVMQDADRQLFTESVMDEVLLSMRRPDKNRACEILEGLSLAPYASRHPLSLSGGQKQRVTVATAIATESNLIVLDEPTSGLDREHMLEVAKLVYGLKEAGTDVFVVTHDPEFVATCCDFALVMDEGCVVDQYALDSEGVSRMIDFFENQLRASDERRA